MNKELSEKIHKQLREKMLEMSEIIYSGFEPMKSKEDLEALRRSSFGDLFLLFIKFAIKLEDRELGTEGAAKIACPLYLRKIEDKLLEIVNE